MHFIATIVTAALFFLWILPLGVFIKPSQEKVACDGQRAICMCSHAKAKKSVKAIDGIVLKSSPNHAKESNASSGGGYYYLMANSQLMKKTHVDVHNEAMFLAYRNPFLKLIEHIPKA